MKMRLTRQSNSETSFSLVHLVDFSYLILANIFLNYDYMRNRIQQQGGIAAANGNRYGRLKQKRKTLREILNKKYRK